MRNKKDLSPTIQRCADVASFFIKDANGQQIQVIEINRMEWVEKFIRADERKRIMRAYANLFDKGGIDRSQFIREGAQLKQIQRKQHQT